MKRCPSCNFIYLDTDEVCDLDGTRLVFVDEKELEGAVAADSATPLTARPVSSKASKTVVWAAVVGLGLGVVAFLVYFAAARRSQPVAQIVQPAVQLATPNPPAMSPTVTPSPSPSVEASPVTERRSDSQAPGSTRATVSRNPVSTSNQNAPQTGAIVRLNNGARIEADEVWRTKEGVWYRRNGVVTLLKISQVKAIEKSSPSQ